MKLVQISNMVRQSFHTALLHPSESMLIESPCARYLLSVTFFRVHARVMSPRIIWIRFRLGIRRESDSDSPALRGNLALNLEQAFVWLLNKNNIRV
jgi:hypothetical protein